MDIAKKMVKQKAKELSSSDISFIKEYISYCKKLDVEFPTDLQKKIVEFAGDMKERRLCLGASRFGWSDVFRFPVIEI